LCRDDLPVHPSPALQCPITLPALVGELLVHHFIERHDLHFGRLDDTNGTIVPVEHDAEISDLRRPFPFSFIDPQQ